MNLSVRACDQAARPSYSGPVLAVDNLHVTYTHRSGTMPALRGVSLQIDAGEAFGLVGESGCGKSTLAFAVMRSLGAAGRVTGGQILFQGRDVLALSDAAWRGIRGWRMTMVYQDPQSALNPSLVIGRQLAEVFRVHRRMDKAAAWAAAERMLEQVHIADAAAVLRRYPHQLSGGMQQRVGLAMALAPDPDLLIVDEPTTGLDVTGEAAVLELVADLRRAFHAAILLISRNVGVIARVCDRVGVLYAGEIVEQGTVADIVRAPRHPYTVGLLEVRPRRGQHRSDSPGRGVDRASPERPRPAGKPGTIRLLQPIPGLAPSPQAVPPGCTFAARCPLARPACNEDHPDLDVVSATQLSRCIFWQAVRRPDEAPSAGIDVDKQFLATPQAEAADQALPALTPLLGGRRVGAEQLSAPDVVVHPRYTDVPRPAMLQRLAWLRRLPVSPVALMLTLLPYVREQVTGMPTAAPRALERALGGLLQRAPQLLSPVSVWELARVCLAIAAGVCAHAWNMFHYPRYQGDEGVYMSAAWAVAHGRIFPYTYSYGHPPLGWALLTAWCQVTGGFFRFGTAIDTGRVCMLGIYVGSAFCVYLIARRLSASAAAALLATMLFSFSPLSVYYQREVLLDNIATFWILLAVFLQVASASRMRYIVGSALAFGLGFLSKETMIVFFPVLVYGTWLQASRFQRRYVLITFNYLALALVSAYVLLAALKNELFPTGTLLGGTNPHVSMITTYLQQAGRGSNEGSFLEQWGFWQRADGLLMVAGVASIAGNLLLGRRRPALRVVALLPLIYFLFLARGGVTFAYYVIPLLPLLALNVALLAHSVIALVARVPWWANLALARWMAPVVLLGALALLLPYDVRTNRTNVTANETGPQVAALRWMGQHVPRSAMIIASHYDWLDMRADGGLGAGYGAPFDHVEMYWVVATDPAIGAGVFHNDWNNVDYIMADSDMIIDANTFHMKLLLGALQHAIPIKTFRNPLYWVTIYQVQHRNSPGGIAEQPPGQEMTLPTVNYGLTTLYFIEGNMGRCSTNGRATVDDSLAVHNANPFPATVTITYLFAHGSPVVVTRTIGPDATLRESVNADIGPDEAAAAIVSSAAHLTAERIVHRAGAPGLSIVVGNASLGKAFNFAAGDTGPMVQEYVTVANPGSSDAHVRVTLSRAARAAAPSARGSSETFTVPANGCATRNIRSDMLAIAHEPRGLLVTSDYPVVLERLRYIGHGNSSAAAHQAAPRVAHETATAAAQPTATVGVQPAFTATTQQMDAAAAHQAATAVAQPTVTPTVHQTATAVAHHRATAAAQPTPTAVAQPAVIAAAHQAATAAAHQAATAATQPTATAAADHAGTAVAQPTGTARQTATAVAHQRATAAAQPTATVVAQLTVTTAAQPTATVVAQPTVTPTVHQTATAAARPTATATAQPTATAVARPTVTPTVHQTATAAAQPTATATHVLATPPAFATVTTTPTPHAPATPSAQPASPIVLLNPATVQFGQQPVGITSTVQTVDVVNVGGAPLTVTSVAISGPDPGDFTELDSCAAASMGATGGCTISIWFTPLTTGTRSATLVITDNAPGSPHTVPLSGQG